MSPGRRNSEENAGAGLCAVIDEEASVRKTEDGLKIDSAHDICFLDPQDPLAFCLAGGGVSVSDAGRASVCAGKEHPGAWGRALAGGRE
jgi:hypothetical protein